LHPGNGRCIPMDQAAEIEVIRSTVSRFFIVYDVKVSSEAVTLCITPDQKTLENNFEQLRKALNSSGYISILDYSKGEYTISIVRKPVHGKRRVWINILLLGATICTTIVAGAILWAAYNNSSDFFTSENMIWGTIFFALPLMTMLGVHELSHYYVSKRNGVAASLPYFIPIPPLGYPPLGTFGAFISMHDPMPSRKALVEIGAAGPLAGLLVAIPVAIIGLTLNATGTPHPGLPPGGQLGVSVPFFYELMALFIPQPPDVFMHPMAFAAWVGFFVTAINLLPAGQLDGGHIARGLLGKNARYLSFATVVVLILLGMFFYLGWLIFAFLIVLLGLTHPAPLNDVTKLDSKRIVVGVVTFMVLVGSFVFVPLYQIPIENTFEIDVQGANETSVAGGSVALFALVINNTGSVNITIRMDVSNVPDGWNALLYEANNSSSGGTDSLDLDVIYQGNATIIIEVRTGASSEPGRTVLLLETISKAEGVADITQNTQFTINIV